MKNLKKLISFILTLVILFTLAIPVVQASAVEEPAYAPVTTKDEMSVEIEKMLNKYSPTSMYILESYAEENNSSVGREIARWYISYLMLCADHVVHENYHGFQSLYNKTLHVMRGSYQLVDNTVIVVKSSRDNIIKTEEATGKLPKNLKTSRWETYVSQGAVYSSNVYGVYGLLDELSAYYYGCKGVSDCTDYIIDYIDKTGYSQELTAGYFQSFSNVTQAFYEFTFWTLEYMLYLKENYPENYKSIMDNTAYRKAFTYFYENYKTLIDVTIPNNINAIADKLNSVGIAAIADVEQNWVRTGEYESTAGGSAKEDIATLKTELSKPKYTTMLNELLVKTPLTWTADETVTSAYNLDTASNWAKDNITSAITKNLVPSALQSNYTNVITRAEFASLAVKLYENIKGEITGRVTFADTTDVNVQKAAFIGVVTGTGNNNFSPNTSLTREQAAVMLARLADALGKPLPKQTAAFADNKTISSWAVDSVGQMSASGIMGGVGDNKFSPQGSYTREQSIVTILRLYDFLK